MIVCLFEDKAFSSHLYETGFQRGLKQTREDVEVLKKLLKLAAKERRGKEWLNADSSYSCKLEEERHVKKRRSKNPR